MTNKDEILNSDGDEVGMIQETRGYSNENHSSNLKSKIRIGVGIVGVVIITIVAIVFYNKSKSEKEQEASVALSRVRTFFDNGDYLKAVNGDPAKLIRDTPVIGLKDIVEQFGSSENSKVAALYAGNSHVALKKQSEAEAYFEKALTSSSVEVVVGANVGIAICKETQNKYIEAGEYYEKASQLASQKGQKDKFKLFAALSFEKAGNKEKSERLYREILHSETMEYVGESKSGLTRLGMIVE